MIELMLVNVAILMLLCLLPRRESARREDGRRTAKSMLRTVQADRRTLAELVVERSRRNASQRSSGVSSLAGMPRTFRPVVVVPVAAAFALALGGPALKESHTSTPSGSSTECAWKNKQASRPAHLVDRHSPKGPENLIITGV